MEGAAGCSVASSTEARTVMDALFYDADGTGSAKQVQIATLAKNLALSHKDFFVI